MQMSKSGWLHMHSLSCNRSIKACTAMDIITSKLTSPHALGSGSGPSLRALPGCMSSCQGTLAYFIWFRAPCSCSSEGTASVGAAVQAPRCRQPAAAARVKSVVRCSQQNEHSQARHHKDHVLHYARIHGLTKRHLCAPTEQPPQRQHAGYQHRPDFSQG